MRSTCGRDVRYELDREDGPAMTETTHEQTAPSEDPVTIKLCSEQTEQFLEALANPPAANQALQKLMNRTPPWETAKA